METINVHQAKTHLSRLLERMRGGETIVIAKVGQPIAELRPLPRPSIVFGSHAGELDIDWDALEADDEALDEQIAELFSGPADPAR